MSRCKPCPGPVTDSGRLVSGRGEWQTGEDILSHRSRCLVPRQVMDGCRVVVSLGQATVSTLNYDATVQPFAMFRYIHHPRPETQGGARV